MKQISKILVIGLALAVVGIIGWGCAGGPTGTLNVTTPAVDLAKETSVSFQGSGFRPGQEVTILYTDPNGIQTDIGYALDPPPVADDNGAWSTKWKAKRFIQKKLIKAGDYTFTVTDAEYTPIDSATVNFHGKWVKKKKKK